MELPKIILDCVNVCADANTLLSYSVLGLFFEWKIPRKYIWPTIRVVLYRMIYGLIFGFIVYFGLRNFVGEVARFVILLSVLTPTPLVDTIYTVEYKIQPADLPICINNLSVLISYFVTLVVTIIINPDYHEAK